MMDYLVRLAYALDRAAATDETDAARLDAAIAELDAQLAPLPIAERFALSPAGTLLLVAAALPGLDLALVHRWQQVAASVEPERRVHELVDVLATASDAAVLVDEMAALARSSLVRLLSGRDWVGDAPLLQRVVSVPERVVEALRGRFAFDPALAGVAREVGAAPAPHPALYEWLLERAAPIVVHGPALVGKTTAIAATASALGRGTIAASLDVLAATGDAARWLADLEREARLLDAVLVLRAGDELERLPLPLRRAVVDLATRGVAVVTARGVGMVRELRAPHVVHIAAPDASAQRELWRAQLGATAADLDAVVRRCSLPAGEIVEAAAAARSRSPDPTTDDLVGAARERLQHRLGDVASVVTTTLSWRDLVVCDDVAQRISEIVAAVHHRDRVLGAWGFADKLPYGRSVSALLAGPPGTGKTMIATLIAKELGLELFRVDLSKIVSKWLGETEKNLATVFDEAQRVGAVLLFDEADALFAKRTEVRSSNDRHANLEVNYLLQRLEQYDGIVLLTTNSQSSIDEAFKRRLRYRIELPTPSAAEREALWRAMMPARAPIARDVDFAAIARRFDMAGGHIKNAVVRAAFLAAERGALAIDHDTLVRAAASEWTELGNLPV